MTIYHNHHIIPRHAGGTDEPSNIARLTTEQHAEAHKKLYAEYGRWQDRLAWHGLAGLVGKDDLVREAHQLKGPKVSAAKRSKFASGETVIWNKGKTGVYNEETLEKMRGSKSVVEKSPSPWTSDLPIVRPSGNGLYMLSSNCESVAACCRLRTILDMHTPVGRMQFSNDVRNVVCYLHNDVLVCANVDVSDNAVDVSDNAVDV